MVNAEPFRFTRQGRSWATLLAVLGTWGMCLVAWSVLEASGWIVTAVLVFTLPAVWDLYTARTAGAALIADTVSWFSGDQRVSVPVTQIDHIRLVTRLDLTVRAAVVLQSGRKLRLPPESTPPHRAFEKALIAQGLKVERHHFTFL